MISYQFIVFAAIQNAFAILSDKLSEYKAPRLMRHELDASRRHTRELVVAVCEEDVAWIDNASHEVSTVFVYDKCHEERSDPLRRFNSTNVIVRNISNVGSCDSAFLSYILERWDTLPDVVEFAKGAHTTVGIPPLSCPKCENAASNCEAKAKNEPDPEHLFFNGTPYTRAPSSKMAPLFDFHLDKYKFHSNREVPFRTSGFKNMGEWVDSAAPELSRQLYLDACCARNFGGHMTATRAQIQNQAYFKGRTRGIYLFLLYQQKYANEEIDHFIERTWMSIFCAKTHD